MRSGASSGRRELELVDGQGSWRRARARLAVALLALVVVLVAPAGARAATTAEIAGAALHPWRFADDDRNPPYWPLDDPTLREQTFSALQAAGIRRARVDLKWELVERNSLGALRDWSGFDRVVAAAQAHGVTLIPMVAYAPSWANGGAGHWTLPDGGADFERFMAAALLRYPQIPAWEIWNEPDTGYFTDGHVDPARFVTLLRAAAQAKAETGSHAQLISGGLAGGPHVWEYFEDLIRLRAFDYVDGFGIHPYGPRPPDARGSFFLALPRFYQRLVQIGHPEVHLWITEYGTPTATAASGYAPALSEDEQADWLRRAYMLAAGWPFVDDLTWYELQDGCADAGNAECRFGLVRQDFSRKPAYGALRDVIAGGRVALGTSVTLRAQARRRGRLLLTGTVTTPGTPAAGVVVVTVSGRRARRRLTVRLSGGAFRATVPVRRGTWRAVVRYGGSDRYAAASSAPAVARVR